MARLRLQLYSVAGYGRSLRYKQILCQAPFLGAKDPENVSITHDDARHSLKNSLILLLRAACELGAVVEVCSRESFATLSFFHERTGKQKCFGVKKAAGVELEALGRSAPS